MIDYLNQLDTSVFLFFNSMHASYMDNVMMLFTGRFMWIPMYAALLLVIIRTCGNKSAFIYLLAIAAAITLTDQTCASIIRPAIERLRPSNPENPLSALTRVVDDYRGGSYGFPSCHSANSFALASFMSMLIANRGFRIFIFTWAMLNSYTRLYLGVHYPGDLLTGAVIGSIFGCLSFLVARGIDLHSIRHGMKVATWHNLIALQLRKPLFTIPTAKTTEDGHARRLPVTVLTILYSVAAITSAYILLASI